MTFTRPQLEYFEERKQEIWIPIPNVEGYEASTFGRIRSLDRKIIRSDGPSYTKPGRILKGRPLKQKPYLQVSTYDKSGNEKKYLEHRLVAMAFHENPDSLSDVDHDNKDVQDNRPLNLTWMSRSDHMDKDQALEYDFLSPQGEHVIIRNMNSFCGEHNLSAGNMNQVFNGKRKQHKGWRKYV